MTHYYLPVAHLWHKPVGFTEKHSFDISLDLPDVDEPVMVACKIELVKVDDRIMVIGKSVSFSYLLTCARCLTQFTQAMEFHDVERTFYYTLPKDFKGEEVTDMFAVDMKAMRIDLLPLLIQEVLMHIPHDPICKPDCKGLCPVCGIDLNIESCTHNIDTTAKNRGIDLRPFM